MEDHPATQEEVPVADVLEALHDPDCRAILGEITDPMTATELTEACDIPQSTVYRKLELLERATLVHESLEVGSDGGRTSRYERDVTDVIVSVDQVGEYSVSITRPTHGADERLADLWSTMGDEL